MASRTVDKPDIECHCGVTAIHREPSHQRRRVSIVPAVSQHAPSKELDLRRMRCVVRGYSLVAPASRRKFFCANDFRCARTRPLSNKGCIACTLEQCGERTCSCRGRGGISFGLRNRHKGQVVAYTRPVWRSHVICISKHHTSNRLPNVKLNPKVAHECNTFQETDQPVSCISWSVGTWNAKRAVAPDRILTSLTFKSNGARKKFIVRASWGRPTTLHPLLRTSFPS